MSSTPPATSSTSATAQETAHPRALLLLATIIASTIAGLAATDLVLPAIPALAAELQGSSAQAQWVLASFAAGIGLGLLLFGEFGARFDQRKVLIAALALFSLTSWLAASVTGLEQLIALRFLQGLTSSAAAVFAPGMIRTLLPESQAIRAIGTMSSIESLTPALAPIVGAWLLAWFGWQASFNLVAICALLLTGAWLALYRMMPITPPLDKDHHYFSLLGNRRFLALASSQACGLGGLLVFVFAAPALFTGPLAGDINDFVIMQMIGVSFFIAAASSAHWWVEKLGRARTIGLGSLLSLLGALLLSTYALALHWQWLLPVNWHIWLMFVFVNLGFGVRGPPGFYAAMEAAGADSARGTALIILLVMAVTAGGTAALAPFVVTGLLPVALAVAMIFAVALVTFNWSNRGKSNQR